MSITLLLEYQILITTRFYQPGSVNFSSIPCMPPPSFTRTLFPTLDIYIIKTFAQYVIIIWQIGKYDDELWVNIP